jgi:hypothetical protein
LSWPAKVSDLSAQELREWQKKLQSLRAQRKTQADSLNQRPRAWGKRAIAFFAIVWLCALPEAAPAQWLLSPRMQIGVEYDSNIYESTGIVVAAPVGRVLFQTRAERTASRTRVNLDYAGALLAYNQHREENKLLQDASADFYWRPASRLQFYARGQGMLKIYLQSAADYGATSGALGSVVQIADGLALDAGAETGQLDYAAGDAFDYAFTGAFVSLRRRLRPTAIVEAGVLHRRVDYWQRFFTPSLEATAGIAQRDQLTTVRLAAVYSRKWLVQGGLEAQRNNSNVNLFDFSRLRVQMLLGVSPAPRWLLRASVMLQHKRYDDTVPGAPRPELDPEREQSNHFILDLSRDLSEKTVLLLRLSHRNNESPVRSLFYTKTVLFAGCELRF